MKRLYRDVAKRIHPDLTSDRKDRAKRQQLMAEANQAYEKGDEARLDKILAEYDCSPEVVEGRRTGAELVRVIRRVSQARGRLAEIEAEMHGLLRSDLYQLKSRVEEAEKSGRDVFVEMIEKVEEQIALAKERLEAPPSALAADGNPRKNPGRSRLSPRRRRGSRCGRPRSWRAACATSRAIPTG